MIKGIADTLAGAGFVRADAPRSTNFPGLDLSDAPINEISGHDLSDEPTDSSSTVNSDVVSKSRCVI